MLPRLLAEQLIYVKKVDLPPGRGKGSGGVMSRGRFREAEVRSLCRREIAEAKAMHLCGETLKNLRAGRKQRDRLAGTAMPL